MTSPASKWGDDLSPGIMAKRRHCYKSTWCPTLQSQGQDCLAREGKSAWDMAEWNLTKEEALGTMTWVGSGPIWLRTHRKGEHRGRAALVAGTRDCWLTARSGKKRKGEWPSARIGPNVCLT